MLHRARHFFVSAVHSWFCFLLPILDRFTDPGWLNGFGGLSVPSGCKQARKDVRSEKMYGKLTGLLICSCKTYLHSIP